jgi:hypothetical protein
MGFSTFLQDKSPLLDAVGAIFRQVCGHVLAPGEAWQQWATGYKTNIL